jgi:hypothetical protein
VPSLRSAEVLMAIQVAPVDPGDHRDEPAHGYCATSGRIVDPEQTRVAIHLTAALRLPVSRQVFSKFFDKLRMRLVCSRPENHRVSTRFS